MNKENGEKPEREEGLLPIIVGKGRIWHKCVNCRDTILTLEEESFHPSLGFFHLDCLASLDPPKGLKKKSVKILFLQEFQRERTLFERMASWREIYPEITPTIITRDLKDGLGYLQKWPNDYFDFILLDAINVKDLSPIVDELAERLIPPRTVVFYGVIGEMEKKLFEAQKLRLELKGMDVKKILLHQLAFAPIREKKRLPLEG